MTSSYYVGGYVTGHPMMLPVVDIVEVGNGGGSIAWIDPAGGLKVGPQSAGAAPGPACYGKGGAEPTVTDANLIAGSIDPEYFLGSGIRLQRDQAAAAIMEKVGKPLGLSLEEAALGILTIANFNMSLSVRAVSVEKGYDPRDCVLVPSGGGGALHAMAIARELSVPRVIIPPMPAHFSALGMLMADLKHDYVQTFVRELADTSGAQIADAFAALEKSATDTLTRRGLQAGADGAAALSRHALSRPRIHFAGAGDGRSARAHRLQRDPRALRPNASRSLWPLGAKRAGDDGQSASLRAGQIRQQVAAWPSASRAEDRGERGRRPVIFETQPVDCPIYLRSGFKAGDRLSGPAVIEELGATILVYPGDTMQVNELGHLVIDVGS